MERTMVSDVAKVYEVWDEYADACHAGDYERWMALWLDDGIQMPPDVPPRYGKEAIGEAMKPSFDNFIMRNMVNHTAEVRICGDEAYSYGVYSFDLTPKAGGETVTLSGKFLDILKKQADGSWKIAVDCHNYNEKYG